MKIELFKQNPEFIDEINHLTYMQWSYMNPGSKEEDWKTGLLKRCNEYAIPTTVIAIDNKQLLGSAALLKHDMSTRRELSPWLGAVYVKKEYRKQGIGGKLVTAIEEIAKKLDISNLYLFTSGTNKEHFYKSLGWETMEWTDFKNSKYVIMMKKVLPFRSNY
jgi:N-acetylglutamate synthase-like GNAT family acetyltransferase